MDDLKGHIAKLREDFVKGSLAEEDVNQHPFLQFKSWLKEAVESKVPEAQAMHLSTVSAEGKPSGRIVYLREFENNRYWFYTNYNSKKAEEITKNPNGALTFFWPELERQIRIEGLIEKASAEESEAYFNARPYESKVGAWASDQSRFLKSRKDLEIKITSIQKQYTPDTIRRPDFWGGFVLTANYYEFWQGRKSRLHDRISYTSDKQNWNIARLSP